MKFRKMVAATAATLMMAAGFAVAAAPSASAAETIRSRTGYCVSGLDADKRLKVTQSYAYNSGGTLVRAYKTSYTFQVQDRTGTWVNSLWDDNITMHYTVNGNTEEGPWTIVLLSSSSGTFTWQNQGYWNAASNSLKVYVRATGIASTCGYNDSSVPY